ncbi:Linalool 8-monooxygenase [Sphingobium chlorophenolicum L-1]|uniref:Linalool 8-monooxygenase n=1 Tax=Sphingobium chlorophenolicum L-1 TaxID=690566 RepID=F6F1U2_SPHCR|nr:cytochrome P450 [Sphingobium chlorophenolicum]AEG51508.1 Linalool 8-monooxygenase [Sphingobium chlorophenolicum L-1]
MTEPLSPESLARPSTFARPADVYDLYARLRRDAPIEKAEPRGYRPFWVMTRHEDIMAVERDPATYAAGDRTVLLPEKVEAIYEAKYGDRNGVKPLTHMDGSYHRAHRSVTMDWFGPKNLRKFEPQIADIAREFVDRMEDFGGSCDFSADIAYWFPLRVVMTLMGVPKEDEAHVLRLTQRLFSPADKDLKTQAGEKAQAGGAGGSRDVFAEFGEYYQALTDDRRQRPRDDIISTIANGTVNGCPMAQREMTSYYVIASTAGHDTTAASIGGGLLGLMQFPEQLAKLRADTGLLNSAAEEFVRWTAPVKHFMRTPREDVTWHGVDVAAGEAIMLCYPSACRDERVFPDGDRFRVDRPGNPAHLAFGYGPHFCLGKFLATMEIRAFYAELLPRLKHVELAGEPSYIESTFVSGLKTLPIRFRF